MKSFVLIFYVLFTSLLSSCAQEYKRLNESEVSVDKLKIAIEFAENYMLKQKNGLFYEFHDDAIDAIRNHLTEENQKAVYQRLKQNFGDFQSLDFAETWTRNDNSQMSIFRFKCDFEKSNKKLELRVVLNEANKIAGLWIKPWSDMLK